MRIVQINLERGWRGGERQTLLTALGLQAAGHRVLLCARTGGELARRAAAQGLAVHGCTGNLGLALALLRLARRADVLHTQTAGAMSVLAALRPLLRRPVVFTRRTAFPPRHGAGRQRWKWARAQGLVAISHAAAAAPRALGLDPIVIPSAVPEVAVDPRRVQVLRKHWQLDGRRVLVTAAALSPEKNPLMLIDAVAQLIERFPTLCCLHCGADGAAGDAARTRVRELGLQGHYHFLGFQEDVAEFLACADVYVSSSRHEALGTSVLDACLAGVPVVATDVGGHAEILAPDRGLLVPSDDVEALARRVAWVLSHPAAAQAMARRARQAVQDDYGVPTMVARYIDLYQRLSAG